MKKINKREWTKDEDDFLAQHYPTEGAKFCEEKLNRTNGSIRKRVRKLGVKFSFETPYKYSEENLKKIVVSSKNFSDVCRNIGLSTGHGNRQTVIKYCKRYNLDTSHFDNGKHALSNSENKRNSKYTLKEILVPNSFYKNNHQIKKKLINAGIKKNECEGKGCNIKGEWLGREITLHLDHINGINNDNRLENLRILCPNCHAATDTYCIGTRNKKESKSKFDNSTFCKDCGISIWKGGKRCIKCENKKRFLDTPKDRPSLKQLALDVKNLGYKGAGKKYGVSDNCIRKWIKKYEKKIKR